MAGADAFAVRFASGATAAERAALADEARAFALEPVALDRIQGAIGEALDRVFGLFDALALVAVIVAALGIVNTLTMNVLERVREIGVLRAAGMTRRQVWRSVVVEAGITGLIGAICGVVAGLVVGALMVVLRRRAARTSRSACRGWPSPSPSSSGVVLAMLAAAYPARLASSVSIVRAVGVRVGSPGSSRRSAAPTGAVLDSAPSDVAPARPASGASMTIALPRLDRSTAAERGLTLADFLVPIRARRTDPDPRSATSSSSSLGALVVALSAQVVIPTQPVPFTGQTFGVLVVGGALGFRRGAAALLLYVAIGALGVPVYAEGEAGPRDHPAARPAATSSGSSSRRPSSGDWPSSAGIAGSAAPSRRWPSAPRSSTRSACPWLKAATGLSWSDAVAVGMTKFLIWDAAKLAIAAGIFPVAWWIIGRRPDDR